MGVERRTGCSQCSISILRCEVPKCLLHNYALYSIFVLVVFWLWVIFLNSKGRKRKKSNHIILQLETPSTPIVKRTSSIFPVWTEKLFPVLLQPPLSTPSHAPQLPTALTPCITHTHVSACSSIGCLFSCSDCCSEWCFSVLHPLILCAKSSLSWSCPRNPEQS